MTRKVSSILRSPIHTGALTHREEHFGPIGRDGVRIAALRAALDMLREKLDLSA